jgi:hypothetical protein
MNNAIWHKGPPPSIGWWPASRVGVRGFYRWWDGTQWSAPAGRYATAAQAELCARSVTVVPQSSISWLPRPDSWPARSRT